MTVVVSAISNCDDATVFWRVEKKIAGCWGFAIERERKEADGSARREVLKNRAGLPKDRPRAGETRPSTEWPFQRFSWTDHEVNSGDTVRYRVTPMMIGAGRFEQNLALRSAWTKWMTLSGEASDGFSAYFNRGLVISQFMARYLEQVRADEGLETLEEALGVFKKSLDERELPIRRFLSGELRLRMLKLLEDARKKKQHVWAALYELEDDELIEALEKLGTRGHVVLANGSVQKQKGETAAEARKRGDQNKAARLRLKKAKLEVCDRRVSPGALGHNKFVVVSDARRRAASVWTGSTNWTKTGLCTQINNGLLVENAAVAREFLDQWDRLKSAGSEFPEELVDANSLPAKVKAGKSSVDVWFTRSRGGVDMEAIEEVVRGAKEGVLFLMFQPGAAGTLRVVKELAGEGKLYVKGVVSTLPSEKGEGAADDGEEESVEVTTVGDGEVRPAMRLDIVQPQGVLRPFANWAATVGRREFLFGANKVGFAIVHSKLIVVDPFTRPVVITGSHNFSGAASGKNDENFVVVRGNRELAMGYAAHVLSVYQHYRWLNVVYGAQRAGKKGYVPLVQGDGWQERHLSGTGKREMGFWK